MSQAEHYDALILGTGQGGKLLAWHLARTGHRTAAVERRWIGGSCPNIACLPTKNEIWSAKVAQFAHHAAQFGTTTGPVATDVSRVRQRKRDMVEREVAGHLKAFKESGAELIMGSGRFVEPKVLEVRLNDGGTRLITANHVYLNVGSHAALPDIPGLTDAQPLTHIEALELDHAPSHLIVLGGGYVGIELAQAFRRFGSAVTLIEPGPRLMRREDTDVAEEIARILTEEGIHVLVGVDVARVTGRSGQQVRLEVNGKAGDAAIEGSDILVATGRVPNTQGIGLEETGVTLDERGYIRVNARLETSAPGVWAIGECAGSPQFTHASVDDFRVIRDNLAGDTRSTQGRLVPYCMFTDPQLAHVGLNEQEAEELGIKVRVARMPTSAILRTQATDETQGFMKALVAADDDRILGFTMIGADAGEVVAAVQMAMLGSLPYPVVRDAILAHPTMAEGLGPLFAGVPTR